MLSKVGAHWMLLNIPGIFLFIGLHIFSQVLGFGEYIEEVCAAYEQHKLETMVSFEYECPICMLIILE
jgi:hypothetical protein